jgi:hypothetical protein
MKGSTLLDPTPSIAAEVQRIVVGTYWLHLQNSSIRKIISKFVACLTYSLTLKNEKVAASEMTVNFTEPHKVIS